MMFRGNAAKRRSPSLFLLLLFVTWYSTLFQHCKVHVVPTLVIVISKIKYFYPYPSTNNFDYKIIFFCVVCIIVMCSPEAKSEIVSLVPLQVTLLFSFLNCIGMVPTNMFCSLCV
jgi:hypothetical protein